MQVIELSLKLLAVVVLAKNKNVMKRVATVANHLGGPVVAEYVLQNKGLNALTIQMAKNMRSFLSLNTRSVILLRGADGAFCSGGDVKSLAKNIIAQGEEGVRGALDFFAEEASLILDVAAHPSPVVALWDGVTFGGGIGVSLPATYRITTEKLRFAMPEGDIGFFVDVGVTLRFSRLRGAVGMYLALTGNSIGAHDALWLGLATHFVRSENVPRLLEQLKGLTSASDLDAVLQRNSDCVPFDEHYDSSIRRNAERIDRMFGGEKTLQDILTFKADDAWTEQTLRSLKMRCPMSLEATFQLMKFSRSVPDNPSGLRRVLGKCLALDGVFVRHKDFLEGIRSVLIDKTRDAVWTSRQDESTQQIITRALKDDMLVRSGLSIPEDMLHSSVRYGASRQIYNPWLDMGNASFDCYGCSPKGDSLRLAFFVDDANKRVTSHHVVSKKSFPRTAHGGILALLIDEVSYFAYVVGTGKWIALTGSLKVTYKKAVVPGEWVVVSAHATAIEEKKALVEVTIKQGNDVCAMGAVEYVTPKPSPGMAPHLGVNTELFMQLSQRNFY